MSPTEKNIYIYIFTTFALNNNYDLIHENTCIVYTRHCNVDKMLCPGSESTDHNILGTALEVGNAKIVIGVKLSKPRNYS